MKKKPELLSLRAYARHRGDLKLPGKSLSTVQHAIVSGRIPYIEKGSRKYIDPVEADAAWLANTEHQLGRHGDEGGTAPVPDGGENQTGHKVGSTAYLKARELELKIARQQLELEETQGRLVDREKEHRAGFELGRRVRDRVLNVSARIAAQVAAETDERKVELMIDDELRSALEEFVDTESGSDGG